MNVEEGGGYIYTPSFFVNVFFLHHNSSYGYYKTLSCCKGNVF